MIHFLLKGLLRDRSRSLFPLLVVIAGVMLTVFLHAYINGAMKMIVQTTAQYSTGHVRVMTKAYAKEADRIPNDLALLGIEKLLEDLKNNYTDVLWTPRIKFGGLIDIPDDKGETRAQSPIYGMAIDLFNSESVENKILNIHPSIIDGQYPHKSGEILLAHELAEKLNINIGETATLISSTMNGSVTMKNFKVAGTVRFGVAAMDRGTMIADISDLQQALDMPNGAGEILGFFKNNIYSNEQAEKIADDFNSSVIKINLKTDEFQPAMGTLRSESGLADYIDLVDLFSSFVITIFVFAMSLVLWNTGLTGSLRRYGEIGIRLAIGEDKGGVYRSLLAESLLIGFAGSIIGTMAGLTFAYYLQAHGLDVGDMMKGSELMVNNIIRAQITPFTYFIGFFPGMLATFIGTAISGIGVYKRQTATLFKEFEA